MVCSPREYPPKIREQDIWKASGGMPDGQIERGGRNLDGWSANIARSIQPCLRPPRWSDPQVRRMFNLPGPWIAAPDVRCLRKMGIVWLIRVPRIDGHLPSVLP